MAADILIIDDEADIRELIAGILEDEGYETRLAHNSDAALAEVAQRRPSLIILDIWLMGSKLDGLDLLNIIKEKHPEVPVIIISGHGNIETAVAAIKRGAYEYIEKPFKADRLILVVGRALETSRLKRENEELKGRSGAETELLGNSAAMRQLRQLLKKIAPSNSRVLITGPMGAGKELAARTLHAMSLRAAGPFVTLSAAALAPERLEEEPFGVEGGYVPDLVATGSSPWAVLAKRPCVRKVLGRDGVTGGAWHGAVEDQCVIVVANLAQLIKYLCPNQFFNAINSKHTIFARKMIVSSNIPTTCVFKNFSWRDCSSGAFQRRG